MSHQDQSVSVHGFLSSEFDGRCRGTAWVVVPLPSWLPVGTPGPSYHVFAETEESTYVAYVSEQNLVPDETHAPCRHPQLELVFERFEDGSYVLKDRIQN